jgi:hypothetical protein
MTSRPLFTPKAVALGIGALALGSYAFGAMPARTIRIERAPKLSVAAASRSPDVNCVGGPEAPVAIELIPDQIVREGNAERIRYHAEITAAPPPEMWEEEEIPAKGRSTPPKPTGKLTKRSPSSTPAEFGVSWEVNVLNDRWEQVEATLSRGATRVPAGRSHSTEKFLLGLPDGFYILQAKAGIAQPDGGAHFAVATQYLQVKEGHWLEVEEGQWRSESKGAVAVQVSTGGQQ